MPFALLLVALAQTPADEAADAGAAVESKDAGFETRVVASRGPDLRRVAGSAQVITEQELERRELDDIHRVLAGVPGIYFREEDGMGLRPNIGLRGVNPDRSSKVTLMEDGVLFAPAPYSAPAAYYFPMVTRMTAVEVYKGPGSIRFGPQTVGGAVNLRTKTVPDDVLGFIDATAGTRGNVRLHGRAGAGGEKWGVLLEGSLFTDPGFKVLDRGGNTGAQRGEAMLKAGYRPTDAHLLEVKLGVAGEHSNETYTGIAPEDFAASPYRRYASTAQDEMKWWRTQIEARWVGRLSDRFEVSLTAYRHDFDRNWHRLDHFRFGPNFYDLLSRPVQSDSEQHALDVLRGDADSQNANESLMVLDNHRIFVAQGVQAAAHAKLETGPVKHELEVGARFHHDQVRHEHDQTGYQMRSGIMVRDGLPVERITDDAGSARAVALHLHEAATWGRFLLAPGARLELIDTAYSNHLTGAFDRQLQVVPLLGLGGVVALPADINLFAGVHQGFSPVSPGQSTDIKPERALHSELGARLTQRKRRLELVGFWSEYSNITGECTGSTGCSAQDVNRQFNGGAARIVGLEAAGALTFSLPAQVDLTFQASYTFTSAKFESDFTSDNPIWGNVVAGDLIPYVPMHTASMRVLLERGPFSASLGGEYGGAFYEEATQGGAGSLIVPPRFLVDATASYDFGPVRLYMSGTNLTNQAGLTARRPYGARPLAPMNVMFGVKATWQ